MTSSKKRKKYSPDEAFDMVSHLTALVMLLDKMKDGSSVSAAHASIPLEKSLGRKQIDWLRQDIEDIYDVAFVEKGPRGANVLTSSPAARELIDLFKSIVCNLDLDKQQLIKLKDQKQLDEVTIGTIPSIAAYLMPHVVLESNKRLRERVDYRIFQGLEEEHFRAVQTSKLDFAISASGDKRAQAMGLEQVRLNYRRSVQGITFLHKIKSKPGPFPELSRFIDKPNEFSEERFYVALKNSPLALMHTDYLISNQEYGRAIVNLFSRESNERIYDPSGQRYYLPTYRIERHFVLHGYAVGFGHPPMQIPTSGKRKIGGHDALLGSDANVPDRILAFFPASALAPYLSTFKAFENERFSIYLRSNWKKSAVQGGISHASKTCVEVIQDICKGGVEVDRRLKFETSGGKSFLVHNFISPDFDGSDED